MQYSLNGMEGSNSNNMKQGKMLNIASQQVLRQKTSKEGVEKFSAFPAFYLVNWSDLGEVGGPSTYQKHLMCYKLRLIVRKANSLLEKSTASLADSSSVYRSLCF